MRVAIAENSKYFLPSLVNLITATGNQVVLAVPDGVQLLQGLTHTPADIAILDVQMPPGEHGGIATADQLRVLYPAMGILFLSQYDQPFFLRQAIPVGQFQGVGYWSKDSIPDVDVVARVLATIAAGGMDVEPRLVARIGPAPETPVDRLSAREKEALRLVHAGLENAAIAGQMVVSRKALEGYLTSVYNKLGIAEQRDVNRRVRAAAIYEEYLRDRLPPR